MKEYLDKSAKCPPAPEQEKQAKDEEAVWLCDMCDKTFATQQAMLMHARMAHGVRAYAKQFVAGSVCPNCHRDFRSRIRCIRHLQCGAKDCVQSVLDGRLEPLSEKALLQADQRDKEEKKLARKEGRHVYQGPPILEAMDEVVIEG